MSNKKKPLPQSAAKAKSDSKKPRLLRFIGFTGAICFVLAGLAIAGAITSNSIASGAKPGFYQNGTKRMRDVDPFVTVGGMQVTYNEYRYHYLSAKDKITTQYGGEDYWIDDPQGLKAAEVKNETEVTLRTWYSLLQYAKEKGIGLTEEESGKIDSELFTVKEQQGAMFADWLKEKNITSAEGYKLIRTQMRLIEKAKSAMMESVKASDMADEWKKDVISLEQIFLAVETTADEEEWAEAEKVAKTISGDINYAPLWNKENMFKRLKEQYNADLEQPENGYTMGAGKNDTIYNAALELQEGEVSEPVRSANGFHIVLRRELDEEAVQENKTEIQNLYYATMLNKELLRRQVDVTIKGGKYYSEVRIATIK